MTRPPTGEFASRLEELDAGLRALDALVAGGGSQRSLRRTLLRQGAPHASSPFAREAKDVGELIDQLTPVLEELPAGEPGIAAPPTGLRVAVICDEPLLRSFAGLAELIPLTSQHWRRQLEESGAPDLMLVTPVVSRPDGDWAELEEASSPQRELLIGQIIPHVRTLGVPVVFWGTQVPRFYPQWRRVAAEADHVLSSTAEHLDRYAQDCPRAESVGLLTLGVNPLHHSPIGSRPAATDLIPFFGTWHERLFPQRRQYATWLVDGVLDAGRPLALLDRRSQDPSRTGETSWPPHCTPYLTTTRSRDLVARLHRAADLGIALNSAVASQTMFSDRVLELEASGTLVLSTYSQGVNSTHPHVHIAQSPEDVAAALEVLTLPELRRAQGDGIRTAFLEHHAADRLRRLAAVAGVTGASRAAGGGSARRVLAVAEEPTDALAGDLAGQTLGVVELVSWEELSRQAAAGAPEVDMLLPVSPHRRYSATYAADHLATFSHQRDCVSTKLAFGGAEADEAETLRADAGSHRHRVGVDDLTLSAWWRPGPDRLLSAERLEHISRSVQAYASDGFGHRPTQDRITVGERITVADRAADDDVAAVSTQVRQTAERLGLRLTVVVPVFDNGEHLRHKAFASLRRSSMFEQMHVLLIDDGSRGRATVETVEELARRHPNVSAYRFGVGGSGSASRPRDLGVRLAATEHLAFLDPDDEMVSDGLAKLVADLDSHPQVDFVLGNFTRWSTRHQLLDHHAELREVFAEHLDEDGTVVLPPSPHELWGFRSLRIHAAVVRTAWLQAWRPVQPEGAAGQDNFLAQQIMHRARRIRTVDVPVNAYYSEVAGSMVNSVSPRYFRKYVPLDRARADWLRENGLLETYRRTRFEGYTVNWYLKKLRLVPEDEWRDAAEAIAEILSFYGDHDWTDPTALAFFDDLAAARAAQHREDAGD